MPLKLYSEAPKCPECNVPMKFSHNHTTFHREENPSNTLRIDGEGVVQQPYLYTQDEPVYQCMKCYNMYLEVINDDK